MYARAILPLPFFNMKNAVNGVAICGCCWGLRVLEIFEKCVEIDKAAGTISYGDGRDNPLIDKVLDQPCADGAVRVELVDLGYCLGDVSHSCCFH